MTVMLVALKTFLRKQPIYCRLRHGLERILVRYCGKKEFYGQWDPPVDKVLWKNYFTQRKGGIYVECGASDGVSDSSTKFFEEALEWHGLLLEPSRHAYPLLKQNRPRSTCLNLALSDHNGKSQFSDVLSPTGDLIHWGSLGHLEAQSEDIAKYRCRLEAYEIEIITFDALVAQQGLTHIDLMVLDVEGHELEVLAGINGPVWPEVFCIEYPYCGLETLNTTMASKGYYLDFVSFNNAFYTRRQNNGRRCYGRTGPIEQDINGHWSIKNKA